MRRRVVLGEGWYCGISGVFRRRRVRCATTRDYDDARHADAGIDGVDDDWRLGLCRS